MNNDPEKIKMNIFKYNYTDKVFKMLGNGAMST